MYGQDQELEVSLKKLRGENSDILKEAAEIRVSSILLCLRKHVIWKQFNSLIVWKKELTPKYIWNRKQWKYPEKSLKVE